MTQQSGGVGVPITQTVAGVLAGNILAPSFATNGTTPILGTVSTVLPSAVSMTNANQFYDGPTVALTAGQWLLLGSLMASKATGVCDFTAKLWDGVATTYASSAFTTNQNYEGQIPIFAFVTLAAPTTVRASVAADTTGAQILVVAGTNPAGNTTTYLLALRIA